jgi:DNA-binding XRE family transcriptional regulator
VDDADLLLTEEYTKVQVVPMRKPHYRPPAIPPLDELIALRQKHYPNMLQKDFAKLLGITRLHMTSIEVGRRRPSIELALRWLALLAPEARFDMFGSLPVVEERLRMLKQLQKVSPDIFKAVA